MYEKSNRLIRQLVALTWPRGGWSRAGRALGIHREAVRRLDRRKRPPPIHLALRLRDVLGLPLAYWADGFPERLDPRSLLFISSPTAPVRTWNDIPPSFEPHGRLLTERVHRAGCSLAQTQRFLHADSRCGVRRVLSGRHAPNARIAFFAWRHFGFVADWWRLADPPDRFSRAAGVPWLASNNSLKRRA